MTRTVRASLLVILLCMTLIGQAQSARQDSLWRVWADTGQQEDERLNALRMLYETDSLLTTEITASRVMPAGSTAKASEHGAWQRVLASYALGRYYEDQHRHAEALPLLNKAFLHCTRPDQVRRRSFAAMHMSFVLSDLGQWKPAVRYKSEAITGFEALKDSVALTRLMTDMGYLYGDLKDTARSVQYFERALALVERRDPCAAVFQMCLVASMIPASERARDLIARAKAVVAESKCEDRDDRIGEMEGYQFLERRECDSAFQRFDHILKTRLGYDPPWVGHEPFLLMMMARARNCAHRYHEAVQLSRRGLELSAAGIGMRLDWWENAAELATAYEGLGDHRNALILWKKMSAYSDSLSNELSASTLAGAIITANFEAQARTDSLITANERALERAAAEGTLQRERNRRNVFLFSGIGILLMAGGLWSRLRYTRRSRAAIQKEKDISEGLLLNILPEEVAEELKAKGHADAKLFDQATILFSDFKGFTEASERMSPQELVAELNTCFEAFDHIITARGIEKIKTIGDAYMCVGGLPEPRSSAPADVVHAALEMQAFITERKALLDAQGRPAFQMRVGIHTGPVVAGIVGVKKFAYDIWGDTVNTASRMESSGEVGQVNISESTYALVREQAGRLFDFEPRGKVQAKGKGEMEMYFVSRA